MNVFDYERSIDLPYNYNPNNLTKNYKKIYTGDTNKNVSPLRNLPTETFNLGCTIVTNLTNQPNLTKHEEYIPDNNKLYNYKRNAMTEYTELVAQYHNIAKKNIGKDAKK